MIENVRAESIYTIDEISDFVLPIVKKYKAERAVLFGSYARKEADASSDIDVMVVGGNQFDLTDIFCIADDLNRITEKEVDVYEESEINKDSLFYQNIIAEGIELV